MALRAEPRAVCCGVRSCCIAAPLQHDTDRPSPALPSRKIIPTLMESPGPLARAPVPEKRLWHVAEPAGFSDASTALGDGAIALLDTDMVESRAVVAGMVAPGSGAVFTVGSFAVDSVVKPGAGTIFAAGSVVAPGTGVAFAVCSVVVAVCSVVAPGTGAVFAVGSVFVPEAGVVFTVDSVVALGAGAVATNAVAIGACGVFAVGTGTDGAGACASTFIVAAGASAPAIIVIRVFAVGTCCGAAAAGPIVASARAMATAGTLVANSADGMAALGAAIAATAASADRRSGSLAKCRLTDWV